MKHYVAYPFQKLWNSALNSGLCENNPQKVNPTLNSSVMKCFWVIPLQRNYIFRNDCWKLSPVSTWMLFSNRNTNRAFPIVNRNTCLSETTYRQLRCRVCLWKQLCDTRDTDTKEYTLSKRSRMNFLSQLWSQRAPTIQKQLNNFLLRNSNCYFFLNWQFQKVNF